MTLERSFAQFGRAMDGMVDTLGETMRRLVWNLRGALSGQHYLAEAADLAEDVAAERYDVVERSDVRLERDGEHATAYYRAADGDTEEITRYDLVDVDANGADRRV